MFSVALFLIFLPAREIYKFGFREGVRAYYEDVAYPEPFGRRPIQKESAFQFELEETHRAYELFIEVMALTFFMLILSVCLYVHCRRRIRDSQKRD